MKKLLLLALMFSSSLAHSETVISGVLSGEIVWTAEESPYVIDEEVIIDLNSTLIIEPGVYIIPKESNDWCDIYPGEGASIRLGEGALLFCIGDEGNNIVLKDISISPLYLKERIASDSHFVLPGQVIIENTTFKNSAIFKLNLTFIGNSLEYSELSDLKDSIIEKNVFEQSWISLDSGRAEIKNNLFIDKGNYWGIEWPFIKPFIKLPFVDNYPPTITKNTFLVTFTYAFQTRVYSSHNGDEPVPYGETFNISNNFWMTLKGKLSEEEIPGFLQDEFARTKLEYLPILDVPDPETPMLEEISQILN
ncbi:MAG: hypothetical protein HN980_04805 [Waddliaceae bacterium]|jgi:hypothetical protein|nr:hypothetical protein [Candidatus Jacksonbacteria bacterium]MBT6928796.1 hypothetical protein [Waddliaceae bacterium]